MAEASGSTWALVIRDDGEASVVPLSDVPALQAAEEAGVSADENPTFIVLHTQDEGSGVTEVGAERVVTSGAAGKATADNLTDFISLTAGQEEGTVSHLSSAVITIADASQQLTAIGSGALETLPISVLAHEETTGEDAITQSPGTIQIPSAHLLHSLTSPTSFSTTRDGRGQGEEDQKLAAFSSSADRWAETLAYSSDLIEPFECVEATLSRDLTSQLGLTSDSGIWVSLRGSSGEGVRVRETGPGQVVISGSLIELLASRDMILLEIKKIQSLSPPSTLSNLGAERREVGVMCNLISSPSTPIHPASTHSFPSRPSSPEEPASHFHPSHRRRSNRLSSSPHPTKARGGQDRRGRARCMGERKHKQVSKKPEWSHIKVERDAESNDEFSRETSPALQEFSPNVEISITELKTELSCEGAVVVSGQCDMEDTKMAKSKLSSISKNLTQSRVGNVILGKEHKNLTFSSLVEDMELKPLESRKCQGDLFSNLNHRGKTTLSKKLSHSKRARMKEEFMNDYEEEGMGEEKIVSDVDEDQEDDGEARDEEGEVKFKFSCKICSYKSMRENHFLKHMHLHDKGLALYRCEECSFVSIRASHLRRHKMSHAQLVLRCHLCPYTCDDDHKLLAKHVRVRHPNQPRKHPRPSGSVYECEECEYKTSWQYAFQRHRRTHAPAKMIVTHSCPQCAYKTVRREHFLRHIKNVHQNYRPFLCDICGKAFKRQDALKQHHVSHYQTLSPGSGSNSVSQAGPFGFICHICQKVCRSAAYLKEHMATHSEERSFLCEVCGASFKTRSVQRNHVQTIHRRPRAFTCPACDKRFNTNFALRRHMKQHEANVSDVEGIVASLPRTTRLTSSARLCNLSPCSPPLSHLSATTMLHPEEGGGNRHPSPPPSPHHHHSSSAYHITIDGQPAFILPDLDPSAPHPTLDERDAAMTDGGSTVLLAGDGQGGGLTTLTDHHNQAVAGRSAGGSTVAVPVGSTTVHILNQDDLPTSEPGELILTGKTYEAGQTVATDTPGYLTPDHPTSTLLYLTTNFN